MVHAGVHVYMYKAILAVQWRQNGWDGAPEEVSNSCFTGANVLVENLRALHTDEAHAGGSHCSRHNVGLATAWRTIQQHTCAQPQWGPVP